MKRLLTILFALTVLMILSEPASAIDLNFGLFRKRTPSANSKADSSAKTKQLLTTLASDTDVDHRKASVAELKSIDPKTNADIVSTLATALAKDPSADVRILCAEVLGSYSTVYQSAAKALEAAESGDPDRKVRAAAKSSLMTYTKQGYQWSATTAEAKPSNEPPLAKPTGRPGSTTTTSAKMPIKQEPALFKPITQGPVPKESTNKPQTVEPPVVPSRKPIAEPKPSETPAILVPQVMPPADAKRAGLPELPKNSSLTPKEFELPSIPTSSGTSSVPTVLPPQKR